MRQDNDIQHEIGCDENIQLHSRLDKMKQDKTIQNETRVYNKTI